MAKVADDAMVPENAIDAMDAVHSIAKVVTVLAHKLVAPVMEILRLHVHHATVQESVQPVTEREA